MKVLDHFRGTLGLDYQALKTDGKAKDDHGGIIQFYEGSETAVVGIKRPIGDQVQPD